MRKLLLALAAGGLLLPAAAQAQTERGSKLLGVSIGELNYSKRKQASSSFSGELYPTAAYFVADNFALGANLVLSYGRIQYQDDLSSRVFGYGVGPFARYYIPSSSRHRLFGQVGGNIQRAHTRSVRRPTPGPQEFEDQKYTTYGYHGALGYTYFLTPTAALDATAGFYRLGQSGTNRWSNVVDVRVGFSVYLPAGGSN